MTVSTRGACSPTCSSAEWSYHSFDPVAAEQVPWDQLITRYRKVTPPSGLENWFGIDFDDSAWRKGKSPFGHYMGQLPTGPVHKCSDRCVGPGCYGGTKVNSLWEKEVLLLRGTFDVPPLKGGHRYRLRVNDGDHVGSGGGHIIYINGKPLIEAKTCFGRGSGGQPKGAFITKEFLDDFRHGKVTIAVQTFLRYNAKYKVKPSERVPQGKISLHLEEMKLPPMGDDLVLKSATVVPMLTSEWQANQLAAKQESGSQELENGAGKFAFDGNFVANAKLLGTWTSVGQVASIDGFAAGKNFRRTRAHARTFKRDGMTDSPTWIWSGHTLMDLTRYEALKIELRERDGEEYLLVEVGGFKANHRSGWPSPWTVMKRLAR